jgi:EmrB/QacA subfamily drug resistance transporter
MQSRIKKWAPLLVMSLALAVIILDTTILNVTLRTIISDLDTTIQKIQWVITAYSLILAAFTITGGRLGDLYGRKKMFITGAVIFALGSFITSIAHSVGVLIIGEAIIEGIGAALMMPATVSLLRSCYKGRDLALAFGIWGGIASASAALGPVIGGWLSTNYSWRWAFRVNIFVVILLIAGSYLLTESKDNRKPELDVVGVILSALGLLSIVFGFIEASTYGWLKTKEVFMIFGHALHLGSLSVTPLFIILGIIILGFFALWEKRREANGHTPLVSLSLFSNREFIIAALVTGFLFLCQMGVSFSVPIYFQSVLGLDPLHTGLALIPMSIVILVAAPLSAWLVKFISPKHIIQIGVIILMLGFFVMEQSLHLGATQWSLAPGFMLFGFGMGLMMGQTNTLALSAVPVEAAGEAAGVNNTFRQVGGSLGSAVIGSIMLSVIATQLVSGVNASPVIPQAQKSIIAEAVSTQSSSIEFGQASILNSGKVSPKVGEEITRIAHAATIDASRTSLSFGLGFAFIALLISMFLPNRKIVHDEVKVAPSASH